MQKKNIIISIILIAAVGGGMFYAGMQYGTNKTKAAQVASRGNFGGGAGGNGGQRGSQGGQNGGPRNGGAGFISGDVISKDDKSITVKAQDGNSRIIFFSDATTIGKTTAGSISDLNAGEQVMVNGQANPDGSIAAQNIQIRPDTSNNNPQ